MEAVSEKRWFQRNENSAPREQNRGGESRGNSGFRTGFAKINFHILYLSGVRAGFYDLFFFFIIKINVKI
jgi:hypothetical protein